MNHLFANPRPEVVVYQVRCYAWYRFFSCRVYVQKYYVIQKRQCVSKLVVEVIGPAIEVWLEDGLYSFVVIKLFYAEYALPYLLRVVGIVGYVYHVIPFDMEVKATVYTAET